MFALDQTLDPVRGFFLPFSFLERKRPPKPTSHETPNTAAVSLAAARIHSEWIPGPILRLITHVTVDAILFALLAGATLGVFYLLKQLDVSLPFVKVLISVALVCDLALLLLSLTRIVIKTLREV